MKIKLNRYLVLFPDQPPIGWQECEGLWLSEKQIKMKMKSNAKLGYLHKYAIDPNYGTIEIEPLDEKDFI